MVLSQNNRLQFSVEETVSFEKGHEVGELLSISIEPDILVQEMNDYVLLRGYLELTGEYHVSDEQEEHELEITSRMVQSVRLHEDGTAELEHRFPVDITIPLYKVGHLNDIFVFIDAFDYRLDHSNVLTIQADLAIEGLLDEANEFVHEKTDYITNAAEERIGESEYVKASEEPGAEAARTEVHEPHSEPELEVEPELNHVQEFQELKARAQQDNQDVSEPAPAVLEQVQADKFEAEAEEDFALSYRSFPSEFESSEKPFFSEPNLLKELVQDESIFEIEVKKNNDPAAQEREIDEEESYKEKGSYPDFTFQSSEATHEQEPELVREAENEVDHVHERENDNSLYLTKLFTKQEEEEFSRLKMYIVQQDDTIDLICERYDLNVQNLIRVNSLSPDDDVKEGQILFIPEYNSSLSH
jgi:stage VI sporulation protein D